jgi:hypothetical protein
LIIRVGQPSAGIGRVSDDHHKNLLCAMRRKHFRSGDGCDSMFQPRSAAAATIDARRIDRLIRGRAKLRDLVALECGRSNLGE